MDEFVVASAAELLQHLQLVQSWVSHPVKGMTRVLWSRDL